MPGPTTRRKTEAVKAAIEEGKLDEDTIDQRAQALLKLLERTSKFDRPEIPEEQAIDKPEHRALIRETSGQGIVLLKNENNILPLQKKDLTKVAVLGLAKDLLAQGGGSAGVNSHYKVTPWEALEALLGDNVELRYAKGRHTSD